MSSKHFLIIPVVLRAFYKLACIVFFSVKVGMKQKSQPLFITELDFVPLELIVLLSLIAETSCE